MANFTCDANYERLTKNVTAGGGVVAHTYIGGMYEKIVKSIGTEQRYFIYALGRLVAQVSNNGTTSTTQYAHTDSLGSVDALTIKSGTSYSLVESASFDEYGQPRLNTWAKGTPPLAKTTLGYTGHDMDTEYGLINMNARLYDPLLGRFISADSVIGDVYNPQSLNRYSYVLNNPFAYTDPTGHLPVSPEYAADAGLDPSAFFGATTLNEFGYVLPANLPVSTPNANFVGMESPSAASMTFSALDTYQQRATSASAPSGWVTAAHAGLTAASFCPSVCGSAFSVVDAGVYAAQGDFTSAKISIAAAGVGIVSDAGLAKTLGLGAKAGVDALDVARETKPFALGLGEHLDAFAKARGANTYKDLPDPTKWKSGVLDALSDPKTQVHFNLDGVDVWKGVSRAASGKGGATDWELLQIRQNPQFWDTLQFWKGGQPTANPFK